MTTIADTMQSPGTSSGRFAAGYAGDCRSITEHEIIYIKDSVLQEILFTLGALEPECGGLIALDYKGTICSFRLDEEAGFGKRDYRPCASWAIQTCKDFIQQHLRFGGILHSHPKGMLGLSGKDIAAGQQFLRISGRKELLLGVVCQKEFALYSVYTDGDPQLLEIKIET